MKTIKIKRLTVEEIEEIKKTNPEANIEQLKNQTLFIILQLKNIYKWDDIEDMIAYVEIIKVLSTDADTADLDNDQLKLVDKVMTKCVKGELISGASLEAYVELYKEFK